MRNKGDHQKKNMLAMLSHKPTVTQKIRYSILLLSNLNSWTRLFSDSIVHTASLSLALVLLAW